MRQAVRALYRPPVTRTKKGAYAMLNITAETLDIEATIDDDLHIFDTNYFDNEEIDDHRDIIDAALAVEPESYDWGNPFHRSRTHVSVEFLHTRKDQASVTTADKAEAVRVTIDRIVPRKYIDAAIEDHIAAKKQARIDALTAERDNLETKRRAIDEEINLLRGADS